MRIGAGPALTGLPADADLPYSWELTQHPQDREEMRERWLRAVRAGEEFHAEARIKTLQRGYRWFAVNAIPYREDGGEIRRWHGVLTDIHESRAAIATGAARALSAEHEHEIALELQRALLPGLVPSLPGVTLSAFYSPSDSTMKIGGDWYDAFTFKEGHIAFSVGDVAGHGTRAAMVMGEMRQAIRGAILEGASVEEALSRANQFLFTHQPDIHVTAVAASYDVNARRLRIANAGHPYPPVRRRDGEVETLQPGGPPLGVLEAFASATEITLTAGDAIVFYTDGLIETNADIIAGLEKLVAVVKETRTFDTKSAHAIAARITPQRERQDDIAVLTVAVDAADGAF